MTEIYWKDLLLNKDDCTVENIKEFKNTDELEFVCHICGKSFSLKGSVFKRRFDSDGYYRREIFACQSSDCLHKKRSMVARTEKVRSGQLRGTKILAEKRRGKTFQELYGAEEAENMLKKIRVARAKQAGTEHDPRLGKKHSEETRLKFSKRKQELMQSQDKKYESRLTGEMLTLKQYHEETLMLTNNLGNKYKWGWHKNWFSGKDEVYDSSYELAFMLRAEEEHIHYVKNKSFRLSYSYKGRTHSYIPDFLIYDERGSLIKILEIKSQYTKTDSRAKEILEPKLEVLATYCKENNLAWGLWFEEDLGSDYLRKALVAHENKENSEETISRKRKCILHNN